MLASAARTSWSKSGSGLASYPTVGRLGLAASFRAGRQLIPVCWSVLVKQLMLLFVPLIGALAGITLIGLYSASTGTAWQLEEPSGFGATLKLFPVAALVTITGVGAQAVVIAAATRTLQGERASLASACRVVVRVLPRLVMFGLLYAAERLITSALRARRWFGSRAAANLFDRAWDFATFLAVPVMLYEGQTALGAVRRSGGLVAKRWGVQLAARSVLFVALFVFALPFLLLGALLYVQSQTAGTMFLVLVIVGLVTLSATLGGVLSAALYRFATTGQVATGFREPDMWAVFGHR